MATDIFTPTGSIVVVDDVRVRYRNCILALALAATPTDIVAITGANGKKVRVLRIEVSGAAATATQNIPVQIIARSTANTGGTATTTGSIPVDSSLPAAVAVVSRYTANPAGLGTTVGVADAAVVCFGLATAAVAPNTQVFDFTARNGGGWVLNAATESLAVNLAGVTLANATTANIVVEWLEV